MIRSTAFIAPVVIFATGAAAAPGDVSAVSVDLGSYDGRWAIEGLASETTATMTGLLAL